MDEAKLVGAHQLLKSSTGSLGRLVANASRLERATCALHAHLTPPLDQHVAVAAVRERDLVVVCDSPAWASRLRYQSPQILNHMKAALGNPDLTRLELLVRPAESLPTRDDPRRPSLSRRSGEGMRSVASTLEPGPLRDTLLRLAENVEDRSG